MNDSTYLNACDPNSMRDQGISRNAVYNADIVPIRMLDTKSSTFSSSTKKPYVQFLNRDGLINKTFYSFGGKRSMRKAAQKS